MIYCSTSHKLEIALTTYVHHYVPSMYKHYISHLGLVRTSCLVYIYIAVTAMLELLLTNEHARFPLAMLQVNDFL